MAESESTIISRSAARQAHLKRYFTGRPCKYGHLAQRQVTNGCCVRCIARITGKYRAANYESVLAINRRYRENNKEWYRDAQRRCYLKFKVKRDDEIKRWRQCNQEKVLRYTRDSKRRNPHINRNRKARKRGNGGKHTTAEVMDILRLQGTKCAYCRVILHSAYHVDHIVPLCRGGRNDRANLQVLCVPCNLSKSKRDPIEFAQLRGMLL